MIYITEIMAALQADFREAEYSAIIDLNRLILTNAAEIINGVEWSWRKTDGKVYVQGPYTTGTVAVTNMSKTVTGTGTTWTDFTGTTVNDQYRAKLNFGNAYQSFSCTVASDTSITLDDYYDGTTETGKSYTLYADEYMLPYDCVHNEEVSIIMPSTGERLYKTDWATTDVDSYLRRLTFGNPKYYDIYRDLTNDVSYIRLMPAPSSTNYIHVKYFKEAKSFFDTLGSAGKIKNEITIPSEFWNAIYLRTKRDIYERLGSPKYQVADRQFKDVMRKLVARDYSPPGKESRMSDKPNRASLGISLKVGE